MDIGFIGIGRMAVGMVQNLIGAGHTVTVYNRTQEKAEALAADGATVAGTIADAARHELVISMLADDRALEAIVFSDTGFLAAMPDGAVHVSMATISEAMGPPPDRGPTGTPAAATSRRPCSGARTPRRARMLYIVAAGDPAALDACRPAFDAMGQRTFEVGAEPVAANVVKIAGNFMLASAIETMGEAFALGRRYGLDARRLCSICTRARCSRRPSTRTTVR